MEALLLAAFFNAIAIAIGWYVRRSIVTGKIMIGIRGGEEFWFVRNEDPFTFWTVISFAAFAMIMAAVIALRIVFAN